MVDTAVTPRGSVGLNGAPTTAHAASRRWWILAVVGLAQLMVVLDNTIVNIALPSAQRDLGFSNANRQWIVTAYALAFGSLLLLCGRMGDLFGRKRTFLIGVVGFAAASAVGGASTSFGMFVTARAVQGVFGALLAPSALSLLTTTFTSPKERGRAFGIYGAIAGTGGAIGLLLGGVLTEHLSWRWTMYINLVFAVLAFIGALVFIRRTPRNTSAKLDFPGVVLISAGLFGIVYGTSNATTDGWSSPLTWGFIGGGVFVVIMFLVWQSRAAHPLLPLRIPRDRNRGASLMAVVVLSLGMFGIFLFLTYYLQTTLLYSPVKTGLAFLPMVGAMVFSSQLATNLSAPRLGAKVTVPLGMAVGAVGMVWMSRIGLHSSYTTHVLGPLIVTGLGLGQVMAPSMNQATSGVDRSDAGVASASVNTMQQVGGAVGTALLNTIAIDAVSHYIAHHAPATGMVKAQAQLHSYTTAFLWSAGFFLGGAILTVFMFRTRRANAAAAAALAAAARADAAQVSQIPEQPAEPAGGAGDANTWGSEEWFIANAAGAGAGAPTAGGGGFVIHGVVRTRDGVALSAASLTLISPEGSQVARALSGPDGTYLLAAPGVGDYVVIAAAANHQPHASAVRILDRRPVDHDVVLPGNSYLTGLVREATAGAPIADVTVVVTGATGEVLGASRSDMDGVFTFLDLPPGAYTLAASASGYRPTAKRVEIVNQGATQVTIDLAGGARLRGIIRGGSNRLPLAEARVTLLDAAGNVVGTGITDEDGSYTLADLDAGEYTLVAASYPTTTTRVRIDGTDRDGVDVHLVHTTD